MKIRNGEIDWKNVRRVLLVRLRSIGDTVLATPSLIALKRFLPAAQIDILLEDWVAPLLDGFDRADNVLRVSDDAKSRFAVARQIRRAKYDVVVNLHGGTTSTFFVRASGAPHRVGFSFYRYAFLYNHLLTSEECLAFWQKARVHSAEQQLSLLGFVGVPIADAPKSNLNVTAEAENFVREKLREAKIADPFALIHPAAAFDSKRWKTENFARVAEFFAARNISTVAVAAPDETEILEKLRRETEIPVHTFGDFTLPQITALAARAKIFVGNDSGIAHIAAAINTPTVVIFGSSNVHHWRPWTTAPNEIVYEKLPCQPCAGDFCAEFEKPECIKRVTVAAVINAVEKVLAAAK